MQQAWHIFKKDVRFLRGEIALMWAVAVLFFGTRAGSDSLSGIESLLIALAFYLIARAVFAEPIPGTEQFWLTRPYRWDSLLAAKLLFILLWVNLPVFIARAAIVSVEGLPLLPAVPGLLWSQAMIFLCVTLPVAALAALTPGLVPYLLSMLAAATVWLGAINTSTEMFLYRRLTEFSGQFQEAEFGWIRNAILASTAIVTAVVVLYVQYRKRVTVLARSFACAAAVLGIFAYFSVSFAIAWSLQPDTSTGAFDASSVNIVLRPPTGIISGPSIAEGTLFGPDLPGAPDFLIDLRLVLEGLPEGSRARLHALDLSVRGAGGETQDMVPLAEDGPLIGLRSERDDGGPVLIRAGFPVDRSLIVERNEFAPVSLRGTLYFTVFGSAQEEAVPTTGGPVFLKNGLLCGVDAFRGVPTDYFRCTASLRWPAQLLDIEGSPLNATVSYSPFPAKLDLRPVEGRGRLLRERFDPDPSKVIVGTRELIAYVKKDFMIDNVRLENYAGRIGR